MNKSNSASKIKMKSFDDLFGTNENLEQANANGGEIREIPLASLHTFRNHPFQIHEDKLEEMAESVKQYGVLVPGIARMRPQGGYMRSSQDIQERLPVSLPDLIPCQCLSEI